MIRPKLYYVKMDIRAAFDTIKQDKMLKIISGLLDQVRLCFPMHANAKTEVMNRTATIACCYTAYSCHRRVKYPKGQLGGCSSSALFLMVTFFFAALCGNTDLQTAHR